MSRQPTRTVVVTSSLGAGMRAASSLTLIGYADECTLWTEVEATPEQWARAMFGDTPDAGEQLIWRGLLGFRLRQDRSPDTVGGWRVTARAPGWIRLESDSWLLTGNMLVRTAEQQVSLTTLLEYRRLLGRLQWAWLSPVHRRLAPRLLRSTAAVLGRRTEHTRR